MHLAAAYHALGQTRLALETLTGAQNCAVERFETRHFAAVKSALGANLHSDIGCADAESGEPWAHGRRRPDKVKLNQSINLSRSEKDAHSEASAWINLANLHSYQNKTAIYADAGLWYDALGAISDAIGAHPDDASLREQRASLLKQVGLVQAAALDKK